MSCKQTKFSLFEIGIGIRSTHWEGSGVQEFVSVGVRHLCMSSGSPGSSAGSPLKTPRTRVLGARAHSETKGPSPYAELATSRAPHQKKTLHLVVPETSSQKPEL